MLISHVRASSMYETGLTLNLKGQSEDEMCLSIFRIAKLLDLPLIPTRLWPGACWKYHIRPG